MRERVEIKLTFSADLDMVPGWGDNAQDWLELIKFELGRNSHYNVRVDIDSCIVKPRD